MTWPAGTGNAALLAAARGAHVVAVDGAAGLLQVAGDRAAQAGVTLDLREGSQDPQGLLVRSPDVVHELRHN